MQKAKKLVPPSLTTMEIASEKVKLGYLLVFVGCRREYCHSFSLFLRNATSTVVEERLLSAALKTLTSMVAVWNWKIGGNVWIICLHFWIHH